MKRTFVYKNTSTWPDAPTHEVSRGHIKVIKHFNNTYYLWRFGLPPDCNSYREHNSGCCYHTSRHMHTEEESLVSVISDGIVQMCVYFFTLTISTAYLPSDRIWNWCFVINYGHLIFVPKMSAELWSLTDDTCRLHPCNVGTLTQMDVVFTYSTRWCQT